jgi:hypothetical protein
MYDRDALIAAVDLRALADELLGARSGSPRSPTWRCPNAGHAQTGRTPPVTVFTSRRGEQRWRCHGCGAGGTAIDLVMTTRSTDLRGALEHLAARAGHLAARAGHLPQPPSWTPQPRARPAQADLDGLNRYVDRCAEVLWQPSGRAIREWLTGTRGLPEEVLRANRVGADLGPRRQARPDGLPRASGAVLPVIERGHATYAQIRVPHPRPDRPRYLNPTAALAPNPRIGRFRPAHCVHPEVIVTEGAIDALSANAAGYRAVAVLSAAYPDRAIAHALSRLPYPLVVAFDADEAGQAGAEHLAALLRAEHHPAPVLRFDHGDLNDALRQSSDWPNHLAARFEAAAHGARARDGPALSR